MYQSKVPKFTVSIRFDGYENEEAKKFVKRLLKWRRIPMISIEDNGDHTMVEIDTCWGANLELIGKELEKFDPFREEKE